MATSPPSEMRRRNLGDVHRGDDRRAADGDPPDESGNHQDPPGWCQCAAQRRDQVEDRQEVERLFPPDGIRRAIDDNRADDRPDEHAEATGEAMPEGIDRKAELDGLLGP